MFNALEPAKDKMVHFGGHHMAVGLTAKTAELSAIHCAKWKQLLQPCSKPCLSQRFRLLRVWKLAT
ncbi:hypothetical protein PY97_12710 [Lacticaseibacillus rhamnosus]|nr:hypothetical protein PY97_12710 [Lacticaseibacillus rhamnosus]